MSKLAQELDERLQHLDPETAAHVERLVREALALTRPPSPGTTAQPAATAGTPTLEVLASIAEPMGPMTDEEMDRAIYGR
jgi:hypothetical protein